jgi:dihydroxy-acid dehydratase
MADKPDAPKTPVALTGMKRGLTSYGDQGFSLFLRKAFIKGAGYTDQALDRPVIGIVNTGSAYNPCHGNMPQLIEAVKRGVMLAGGLPMDFPTISIHESFASPTSMYLRNLMSMDTEEMIRAQPMDAVVLIGGCDKTVPAQLMGAASAGMPAVQLITGSMLTGSHRGERVGACTDCRRYWAKFRANEIDEEEVAGVNNQLVASVGTCSVMGTASTMACIAEALGMTVPSRCHGRAHPRSRRYRRIGGQDRARRSDDRQDPHAEGFRECHARAARHWRVDERDRASECYRGKTRARNRSRQARQHGQGNARAA